MDISSVINFLSEVTKKDLVKIDEETRSSCESKMNDNLLNKNFSISINCFNKMEEDIHLPKSKNDFLIIVGIKNILILKQTKDINLPILSMITGSNSQISEIEFLYPIDNTGYFVVKNKNDNKILIFDYRVTGNINPSKVLNLTKIDQINKVNFSKKTKEITFFGNSGLKEVIKFNLI